MTVMFIWWFTFEELQDTGKDLEDDVVQGLELLRIALDSALELLRSVFEGSKIFQAPLVDKIAGKFERVTKQIEEALSQVPYNELDITEEVREQIELLHAQFKRAIGRLESPNVQLAKDLAATQIEDNPDPICFKRLSEKLHLRNTTDIKRELLAIHEMNSDVVLTTLTGALSKKLDGFSFDLVIIDEAAQAL